MDDDIRRRLLKIMALRTRGWQLGAKAIIAHRREIGAGKVGITQREIAGVDPHMTERQSTSCLAIGGTGAQTEGNRIINDVEPRLKPGNGVMGLG